MGDTKKEISGMDELDRQLIFWERIWMCIVGATVGAFWGIVISKIAQIFF